MVNRLLEWLFYGLFMLFAVYLLLFEEIYILLAVLLIMAIWSNILGPKRAVHAWRDFAKRKGYGFSEPLSLMERFKVIQLEYKNLSKAAAEIKALDEREYPARYGAITGKLGGYALEIRGFTRSAGKSRSKHTGIWLELPGAPSDLIIYPEGLLALLGKFFGQQDIEVGDKAFDRAFVIRSPHQETALRYLDSTCRRELLRMRDFKGMGLRHQCLYLERDRFLSDPGELEALSSAMLEIVRAVVKSPSADPRV